MPQSQSLSSAIPFAAIARPACPAKSVTSAVRPKGSKNLATLIMEGARDQVTLTVSGKKRQISKMQATTMQLATKAAIGDQISPSSGPPGTEFLDAETGRQKQSAKRANARRDQNPGSERSEIPAETPYLASYRKRAVCGDWMVADAVKRNRSPTKNREFSRNSSPKQVSDVPMAAGRSNFDRDSNQLYKQ